MADLNATLSLLGDSFPLTRVIGKGCCRDSVNRGALRWNAALQPGLGEARAFSHAIAQSRRRASSVPHATCGVTTARAFVQDGSTPNRVDGVQ